MSLVLSSLVNITGSSTGVGEENSPLRGKARKDRESECSGEKASHKPSDDLGPRMLLGPWEGWDHNTPTQRLEEHSFTKLGLEICRAVPTTFQRNKKHYFLTKKEKIT